MLKPEEVRGVLLPAAQCAVPIVYSCRKTMLLFCAMG